MSSIEDSTLVVYTLKERMDEIFQFLPVSCLEIRSTCVVGISLEFPSTSFPQVASRHLEREAGPAGIVRITTIIAGIIMPRSTYFSSADRNVRRVTIGKISKYAAGPG